MNPDPLREALEALINVHPCRHWTNSDIQSFVAKENSDNWRSKEASALLLAREALAAPVAGQVAYAPLEPGDIITEDAVQLLSLKGPFPMKEWSPSSIGQPYNPGKWTWAVCRPITIPQPADAGLLESLKSLLFIHENVDETGYVTDVGFYPVDAEIEKARAVIARAETRTPQPAPVGDEREALLRLIMAQSENVHGEVSAAEDPVIRWFTTGARWYAKLEHERQARAALDRSGWIALSERGPTEADAFSKCVMFWDTFTGMPRVGFFHSPGSYAAHWQPLPPPPARGLCPHCGGRHAPGAPFDKCAPLPATGDAKTEGGAA